MSGFLLAAVEARLIGRDVFAVDRAVFEVRVGDVGIAFEQLATHQRDDRFIAAMAVFGGSIGVDVALDLPNNATFGLVLRNAQLGLDFFSS